MTVSIPEHQFVQQLRTRDSQAFAYLYDCYSAALLGEIVRRIHHRLVAEDLLQESIISIFLHIDTYDADKGRLYTWMLTIVRNKCTDYLRSVDHRYTAVTDSLTEQQTAISQCIESKIDADQFRKLVNEQHQRDAKAFELVYVQGCTHQQVSELCAIPLGTLKTRMRSLFRELKEV